MISNGLEDVHGTEGQRWWGSWARDAHWVWLKIMIFLHGARKSKLMLGELGLKGLHWGEGNLTV